MSATPWTATPCPERLDANRDVPSDEYIERFSFRSLAHLDARSWRHYLPRLIDHALATAMTRG